MRTRRPSVRFPALLLAAASALTACAGSEGAPARADWPMYRGDLAGTGYSPLSEITTANVAGLERVWRYGLGAEAAAAAAAGDARPRDPSSQATPIVVGDVMYLPAADRVVAIDPATGGVLWSHAVQGAARRGGAWRTGPAPTELLRASSSRRARG